MDITNKVLNIDVLEGMKQIPDASIDSIITSPPYWQLRDYGYSGQWGLEPTFEEYLEHLWQFMDEAWRVLKPEGTVWVNLGDTYGGSKKANTDNKQPHTDSRINKKSGNTKSLLLIPHRFAIGCIDKGWILRNDIIWAKRNAMPESARDRFSKKHEFIFFFTKRKKYYFDLDSIRCESTTSGRKPANPKNDYIAHIGVSNKTTLHTTHKACKNPGDVSDFWNITVKSSRTKHYATYNSELIDKPIIAGCPKGGVILDPFAGSGTTLVRAVQLGRKAIGIEASEEYAAMARQNLNEELSQLKLF